MASAGDAALTTADLEVVVPRCKRLHIENASASGPIHVNVSGIHDSGEFIEMAKGDAFTFISQGSDIGGITKFTAKHDSATGTARYTILERA